MNEMYTCSHCGQTFSRDDLTELANGDFVCDDCRDDYCEQCEHCGQWYLQSDYELVDVTTNHSWRAGSTSEMWCGECRDRHAFVCSHCEEWNADRMLELSDDNVYICARCSDSYGYCSDCGAVIHEDETHWTDDDERLCRDCWDSHGGDAIHGYSYKPDPIFGYRRNENIASALTFGLELEVDGGGEYADKARKVLDVGADRIYIKHDGSLNEGFEIVSHPGTLAHHMYEMHWANICRVALKEGYHSHDASTCGLHIHVGRTQLGSDGETRQAVYTNLVVLMDKLREELTKFSRRTASQLDNWARFPQLLPDRLRESAETAVQNWDRYRALNFCNGGTIEFRIFRGTLKRDTIVASIQIVNNLCRFAMTHTFNECAEASFADVVNVNPFKELVAYSVSKKLLAPVTVQNV